MCPRAAVRRAALGESAVPERSLYTYVMMPALAHNGLALMHSTVPATTAPTEMHQTATHINVTLSSCMPPPIKREY
jgi:hypothetical protein